MNEATKAILELTRMILQSFTGWIFYEVLGMPIYLFIIIGIVVTLVTAIIIGKAKRAIRKKKQQQTERTIKSK